MCHLLEFVFHENMTNTTNDPKFDVVFNYFREILVFCPLISPNQTWGITLYRDNIYKA